jgi:SAM-dependent methyltransferase
MTRGIGKPKEFAHYDQRRYRTLGVVDAYTAWAPVYGDLDDRFDIDLLEASPGLVERVRDAEVVDLGCGTGRIGAWARQRGAAHVTGVDLTPAMLAHAKDRGAYDVLVRGDLTRIPIATGHAGMVTTSLALCHVADLGAFFGEARRILRPGGALVICDYHPTFLYRGIPSHFEDPATQEKVAVVNHIHAFGQIFDGGRAVGLALRDLRERFVDDEWIEAQPNYQRHHGMPISALWVFDA